MQLPKLIPQSFWTPPIILGLAGAILCADYLTGPSIRFSIWYILPVGIAAWRVRRIWALVLAIVMPAIRLVIEYNWHGLTPLLPYLINTAVQCTILTGGALLISKIVAQQKELRVLKGIIPICCFCKKIRDANDHWESLETYISSHSEAEFSHSFCQECGRKHYPEVFPTDRSGSSH